MSIIKYILISILINIYLSEEQNDSPPDFVKDLKCGKSINNETPKKPKDCTKYGTGSDMLCCFVADSENSDDGECYLLPYSLADETGIKDKKTFTTLKEGEKAFWSCGNKSYFLSIDIIMIFLIIFLM